MSFASHASRAATLARRVNVRHFGGLKDTLGQIKTLEYAWGLAKRYPIAAAITAGAVMFTAGVVIGTNLRSNDSDSWQEHFEKLLISKGLLFKREQQTLRNPERTTDVPFLVRRGASDEIRAAFERTTTDRVDERSIPITVVQGPQGSGKSEMINPLLKSYIKSHRVGIARRILASTKEELFLGLIDLAADLGVILTRNESETQNAFEDRIIDTVAMTLNKHSLKEGPWLLYFDLKDKDLKWLTEILSTHRLLTKRDQRLVFSREFWGSGRVIISTTNMSSKNSRFAIRDDPQDIQIIRLHGLTLEETRELFKKEGVNLSVEDEKDFKALHEKVGGAPLALHSAALYIKDMQDKKGIAYTVRDYLEELRISFKETDSAFDEHEKTLRAELTYKETQKQVINFGFKHTEKRAQDILLLLARLDQTSISAKWLECYAQIGGIKEEQLLHEVCRYGLAVPTGDGIVVHNVVLEELKRNFNRLSVPESGDLRLNHFKILVRKLQGVAYPAREANKKEQDLLVEQIYHLFDLPSIMKLEDKNLVAETLIGLTQYHLRARDFKKIQESDLMTLLESIAEADLKPHLHAERLLVLTNYYLLRNQFTKARTYCAAAGTILDSHPNLELLAEKHRLEGRAFGSMLELDKALEQLEIAKELFIRAKDDLGLRDCLFNIAAIKKARNLVEEGIHDYEEALRLTIKLLGDEHQEAARIYNDLGLMEHLNGDDRKAQYYLQRAVTLSKHNVGNVHTDTSQFIRDAASVLLLTDPEQAERDVRESITIQEANKENRAMIARSKMVLGNALLQQGKRDEALAIYEEVKAIRLIEYPDPKHPEHANVLLALAKAKADDKDKIAEVINDLEQAKTIYEANPKALKLFERTKNYLELTKLLAEKYLEIGQRDKALAQYSRLFELASLPLYADMRTEALTHLQQAGISKELPKAIAAFHQEARLKATMAASRDPEFFGPPLI